MNLFSYIVRSDSGLAPNPFWGVCTLACCKPRIRRAAKKGDLIVGLTPKPLGNKIVYIMRVTQEKMTFAEYWNAPSFQRKKPDLQGSKRQQVGDNFYCTLANGMLLQQESAHSPERTNAPISAGRLS